MKSSHIRPACRAKSVETPPESRALTFRLPQPNGYLFDDEYPVTLPTIPFIKTGKGTTVTEMRNRAWVHAPHRKAVGTEK